MAQAPDAYAQRLLAERARREAARKAAASAPQRKPQIGMPSNLGQMVSRQPAPDRVGQVRQAITQGVDYAGNFLAQGRAPEIGGAVRSMVEPVAQFPVTAVTDPMRAANQAQQALDPAYAMARGLTTTRLGAQEGNLGDVASGVTEMGLAGLSFVPGGAAVKGARSMPPAPIRRPPPIGQPNVLAPQASRGPILNQLANQPELLGGGLGGALGATQGETPEERARNALLGAAGGAVGGRMARGMTPDRTRMGSNLGNVPKPVQKAQAAGYEGQDIGEAKEWVAARSKGLDMSQAARMERAKELGFDIPLFHQTNADIKTFDPEKGGRGATFFAGSPEGAQAGAAAGQNELQRLFARNEEGVRPVSIMPVMAKSEGIAGLRLSPTQKQFWETLPDEIPLEDYERQAMEIEKNLGGIPYTLYDESYVMMPNGRRIPWRDLRLLSGAELDEVKRLGKEYLIKGSEPKTTYAEVKRTDRNLYGRQIAHYGSGTDEKAVAAKYKAQGFKGYLINDEGGLTVAIFDPSSIRSTNAAFDPASKKSANILATPPEVGGAFVGGALGSTQGETPEERARNALLGAAGGAVGGRMAREMTPDKTRMGSNLGNVLAPSSPQGPKPNPMGFYSQLEATVTRPNTPGKATGEAWAAWLKSQPGVKAEELEATGVTDWLRAKEGQVSRADVENYVRNNGVQVEEITKKAEGGDNLNVEDVARQLFDESWETNAWDDWMYDARRERLQQLFDAQPQAKKQEWLDQNSGNTELSTWAEETFGRRWDDQDIFSPEELRNIQDEAWYQTRQDYEAMAEQRIEEMQLPGEGAGDTKFSAFTLPGGKGYTELMLTLPTRPSRVPQSMNELTPNQKRDFIRFNDRNAEVQDIPDSQLNAVIRDMELSDANFKDFTQRGMKILPEEAYRSGHWDDPNVLAHVRFKERTGPNGQRILALEEVQSDWHQTGRERGYKGQQIWNVEKDAGGIWRIRNEKGEIVETRDAARGFATEEAARQAISGNRMPSPVGTVPNAPFKDNKWAALAMKRVVKYAADNGFDGVAWIPGNIQNGKFHNATDKRADFYDKIFVNIANDIGKKSGAKAQRLTLDTAPSGYVQSTDFHYLPLTPELRKKAVEQGFPLFSVGAVGAGAAMTGAIRPPEQKKPPGQRPRG